MNTTTLFTPLIDAFANLRNRFIRYSRFLITVQIYSFEDDHQRVSFSFLAFLRLSILKRISRYPELGRHKHLRIVSLQQQPNAIHPQPYSGSVSAVSQSCKITKEMLKEITSINDNFVISTLSNVTLLLIPLPNGDYIKYLYDDQHLFVDKWRFIHYLSLTRNQHLHIPFKSSSASLFVPYTTVHLAIDTPSADLLSSHNYGHWLHDCHARCNILSQSKYQNLFQLTSASLDKLILSRSISPQVPIALHFTKLVTASTVPPSFLKPSSLDLPSCEQPKDQRDFSMLFLYKTTGNTRLVNIRSVKSCLSGLGFSCLDPTQHPFTYVIQRVRQASVIVVELGAPIANLIYAQPNTRVLVTVPTSLLHSPDTFSLKDLWPIYGIANINFVPCPTETFSFAGPIFDTYRVDLKTLVKHIDDLLDLVS